MTLVVADGRGRARHDGVEIIDVGPSTSRLHRMFTSARRVTLQAALLRPHLCQLHDPELLLHAPLLRRHGVKVVFDAHEDVPRQLLDKPYLGRLSARLLSRAYAHYERRTLGRLDGVLAATPHIAEQLSHAHGRVAMVANYPCLDEFTAASHVVEAPHAVCYVGSISAIRGIRQLVQACSLLQTPARLTLAGTFSEPALEHEMRGLPGWSRVDALGHQGRGAVAYQMRRAIAGLVTLLPTASYREALPVKMFEYMAAGIAVIASDFPRWRAIIDAHECGLCVNPHDPAAIAAAIDELARDPARARRLGANGRRAVEQHYHWGIETKKLLQFYSTILGQSQPALDAQA